LDPRNIKFGYVCPTCREVHPSLETAIECLESHVTYELEEHNAMGQEFPIELSIIKSVGSEVKAVQYYKKAELIKK